MTHLKICGRILALTLALGLAVPVLAQVTPSAEHSADIDTEPHSDAQSLSTAQDNKDDALARTWPADARHVSDFNPNLQWTLKDLGARYPIQLRGVEGSDTVEFDIPLDRVVTDADLDLRYVYSPALISRLSHINIIVNNEVAYSVPVPRDEAGINLQRRIPIPAYMITENNQLRLQLIGHYTERCEDPLHSSLWANISNLSTLQLSTTPVRLDNDLALLPIPFFDPRDPRMLDLPFVFSQSPDAPVLEAAGMVASWFGALAGPRGARFPVAFEGGYPIEGNAVVFSLAGADTILAWDAEGMAGPAVSIQTNPNDPFGKLLLITGRSAQELRQAAQALVLGQATLSGQTARITQLERLVARQPYDAPNWVPTDRPVALGDLVSPASLNVTGFEPGPIYVPLRLPPDLFAWRAAPVPMHLKYRYTPQVGEVNSSLIINTDDELLKSIPLLSVDQLKNRGWTETMQAYDLLPGDLTIDIPLDRLLARADLRFQYMYDYIKEGECRDAIINNVRGSIDPNTTLDFSGYSHYAAMPDLSMLDQAGYPFTRMADLSDSAVLLSTQSIPEEIATYLYLMGRFGESTGYPAVGVKVGVGQQDLMQSDKDLLVITSDMSHWLTQWSDVMPARLQGQIKDFTTSQLAYKPRQWLSPDPRDNQTDTQTRLRYDSTGHSILLAGFESPSHAGRSVVLIASEQPHDLTRIQDAFDRGDIHSPRLQGSLAVVRNQAVDPLVAEVSYYVGHLDWKKRIEWEIAQYWPRVPPIDTLMLWVGIGLLILLLLWLWALVSRIRRR